MKKLETYVKGSFFTLGTVGPGRFFYLLISLMLLVFIYPFLRKSGTGLQIMDLFFLIILLAALYAISHNRKLFTVCLVCAIAGFAVNSHRYFIESSLLHLIAICSYGLFFILVAVAILLYVLKDDKVTTNTINGALCFYLLLGIIWAFLFAAIETLHAESFLIFGQDIAAQSDNLFADFIYYSFATLTTLGYGDIAPLSHPSRALSTLEAVTGQMYLAVLIARLVGLHIVHSKK